eukprot:m.137434 g.137434  ORF g.137434 m.137434 type:complete len:118 (+) comp13973_c0_seq2:29-382(+)
MSLQRTEFRLNFCEMEPLEKSDSTSDDALRSEAPPLPDAQHPVVETLPKPPQSVRKPSPQALDDEHRPGTPPSGEPANEDRDDPARPLPTSPIIAARPDMRDTLELGAKPEMGWRSL